LIIHLPTRKRNRQERSLTILRYGNVENGCSADGKQIFTVRWKSRRLSHSPQTSFPTAPQAWPFTHIPTAPTTANILPVLSGPDRKRKEDKKRSGSVTLGSNRRRRSRSVMEKCSKLRLYTPQIRGRGPHGEIIR